MIPMYSNYMLTVNRLRRSFHYLSLLSIKRIVGDNIKNQISLISIS